MLSSHLPVACDDDEGSSVVEGRRSSGSVGCVAAAARQLRGEEYGSGEPQARTTRKRERQEQGRNESSYLVPASVPERESVSVSVFVVRTSNVRQSGGERKKEMSSTRRWG